MPHGRSIQAIRIGIALVVSLPLLGAVVLMAGRVGETARFVTWPIAAFTVLAAAVVLLGLWIGLDRPGLLAVGVLPALVISYVLPALPVVAVAVVLAVLDERVVQLWTHQWLLVVAGMAAVGLGAVIIIAIARGPALVVLLVGLVVVAGPTWFATWFPTRRYAHWGHRLDDISIELVHGSLIRKRSVIPYFRVRHVDTQRGPLERPLGLARLKIHTASSRTDATIPGLHDATAAELRAVIVSRAGLGDGV